MSSRRAGWIASRTAVVAATAAVTLGGVGAGVMIAAGPHNATTRTAAVGVSGARWDGVSPNGARWD